MKNKVLIILFELGFGITFNLIGIISISELFLLLYAYFFLKGIKFSKFKELKTITYLYAGLLISQIISELIVGNTLNNALKGIAITIVSYLHFMFLFSYIIKDKKLIIYAIIGIAVRQLIFGTEFEGNLEEVLSGQNAAFLKFYIAPLIINLLLIFSIITKKKIVPLIFAFVGLAFIILGARNSGVTTLLTGVICYLVQKNRRIDRRKITIIGILTCVIGYSLYTVYVNKVLSGEITSGNSEQLRNSENPYNPINLLIVGRTETFVGFQAFMEKPWTGHGAWTTDKSGKYILMMEKIGNKEFQDSNENTRFLIPSHSVLIGAGTMNGLFAFIFMMLITIFFLRKGIQAISLKDKYLILLISILLALAWNTLFSPQSHFRLSIPFYYAIILSLYYYNKKRKRIKHIQYYKKNKDE